MGNTLDAVNWHDYEPYFPETGTRLAEAPRAVARTAYDRLMAIKSERIDLLVRLAQANGADADESDQGVQALNDWFRTNVTADAERPGFMATVWYSVARDIGLFLGETLIGRHPQLHWEFFIWGKPNVAYQRPVVMGFSQSPNPHRNVDFDRRATQYGHQIIASQGSTRKYGHVNVRGVDIDVDLALEASPTEINENEFVRGIRVLGDIA